MRHGNGTGAVCEDAGAEGSAKLSSLPSHPTRPHERGDTISSEEFQ